MNFPFLWGKTTNAQPLVDNYFKVPIFTGGGGGNNIVNNTTNPHRLLSDYSPTRSSPPHASELFHMLDYLG